MSQLERPRLEPAGAPCLSRRRALQLGAFGIGAATVSPLIAACGGDDDDDSGGAGDPTATSSSEGSEATEGDAPEGDETPEEQEEGDGGAPTPGGELIVGVKASYIDVLDPNITAQTVAHEVMMPMFDMLVYQDNDKVFWPGLATSWEISDDGLNYTFTLQEDVLYHDGTPCDAESVVANFERMIAPESASRLAGPRLSGFYDSSEATDATTVSVTFSQPNGSFLTDLSQNFMAMLSPTAVEEFGPDEIGRNPVGTGPFIFVEWVENSHITMERNEDYAWPSTMFGREGTAYLDSITWRIIPEDTARMAALDTGELNFVDQVPTIDFARIQDDSNYTTYSIPQPGIPYAYMMNTSRAPTDDLAVRRAINFAVDKEAVVQTLYQGLHKPAHGPLSAVSFTYNPEVEMLYSYDPDQARQVLEEGGWVDGPDGVREKDGQRLELNHYVFTDTQVAEVMQSQLAEVGIATNITLLEVGAVNEAATRGDDTNFAPLPYRDADPAVMCVALCIKNEGAGFAWTFHENQELDDALEEGQAASDPAEREELYGKAQMIAMEEALLIPVYDINGLSASSAEVRDVTFDVKGVDPWVYNIWIAE